MVDKASEEVAARKGRKEMCDSILPKQNLINALPFNLTRPPHLLAKDLVERIERRNNCKFVGESYEDVERLILQLIEAEDSFADVLTDRELLSQLLGTIYELLHIPKSEDISAVHAEVIRLRSVLPEQHSTARVEALENLAETVGMYCERLPREVRDALHKIPGIEKQHDCPLIAGR